MAIQSGPGVHGTRHISKNWPVAEGLTGGTTKQVGERRLRPTKESHVDKRRLKGS